MAFGRLYKARRSLSGGPKCPLRVLPNTALHTSSLPVRIPFLEQHGAQGGVDAVAL